MTHFSTPRKHTPYLYFTVFVAGMTSLAAEFGASRLLGNVFGTSNLVWAAIIGLILLYLTAGYFLGGRWADHSPYPHTMYSILALAAIALGIVPLLARPVLRMAANAFDQLQVGVLFGAFVSVLLLLTVPITLLGVISPFAIRLVLQSPEHSGRDAGMIYGISTLGSFLGTFLPTLVLIPTIGTTRTFLTLSSLLLLVAALGLLLNGQRRRALPCLLVLPAFLLPIVWKDLAAIKSTPGQIYESESAYNYIQVIERDNVRYLRLNEGQGVHSIYAPDTLEFGGPWQQFLVAPFFYPNRQPESVKRIAILGLAAGTTARQAAAVFPHVIIDGYEIDPRIVAVGHEYFGLDLPSLNIIIQDARWGLAESPYRYDLICVDAYRPPYIPPHLTTLEFFQTAADHLQPQGALAINVGHTATDRRLIDGLATTLRAIFPSIYVMDVPGTFNSLLYATLQPTSQNDLQRNLVALATREAIHPLLIRSMEITLANLQPEPPSTRIFTDDLAPIEWITNDMILDYLLQGDG